MPENAIREGDTGRILDLVEFLHFDTWIFALQVREDSMVDAGIHEGDFVIVDWKREVKNGDIVVANVDLEWTIKFFQKLGEQIVLIPANKNYKPIYPNKNIEIKGVVTNVLRTYH